MKLRVTLISVLLFLSAATVAAADSNGTSRLNFTHNHHENHTKRCGLYGHTVTVTNTIQGGFTDNEEVPFGDPQTATIGDGIEFNLTGVYTTDMGVYSISMRWDPNPAFDDLVRVL